MDKSNLELFKQALNEAVSNKFDKMADECTEEIVYSEKHKLAMRTIVYGKADTKRVWSPKMKRIIAILIAAALLLTSCGIIFRNEIREIFKDFFVSLTYETDDMSEDMIEEVYTLSYVPEGYTLEKESATSQIKKHHPNQNQQQINRLTLEILFPKHHCPKKEGNNHTSPTHHRHNGNHRIIQTQGIEIHKVSSRKE